MTVPDGDTDNFASRVGRAMTFGAWVAGLALLALYFNGIIERQENPNPNPVLARGPEGQDQVVLQRNRSGHFVASGTINGVAVRFLVDTGATQVALPLDLAERLGLALRPGGLSMTANGTVRAWSTVLDRIELGGLAATSVRATVLPNMPGDDVLLGMSYLRDLEMIQRGDTLVLRPHLRR